ncbi:recombinase family protein [Salipaludibacillus sp. CF4.18]|uniref:recombinase family protein n=1 Tax=Salipaludibacillus sp. CF4.18 TaxID=3373081 RepID=UPI003EE543FC
MRVAIYIRVSTNEQVQEGYSIKAQRMKLEAYAVSQGWDIVQYYVDEGLSAKDMNRVELKRMLGSLDKDVFDCVLVYRLDRLTRSVLDLYEMIKLFEKHDVKFKSATEVYDTTTATGRLFVTLIASLAQWERENTGERISFGMEQKAREGKWVSNTPPYGYNKSGLDRLEINPIEAKIIKEMYTLYTSGQSIFGIAKNLNQRKVKSKRDYSWRQGPVRYILNNPVYTGTIRYNYRKNKENYFEIENAVPAIIEKDTFNLVQEIMKKRSGFHPRSATSSYPFSKIAKCARCGKSLSGRQSKITRNEKSYTSYSYYCQNRLLGLCDLPNVSENYLDYQFQKHLSGWDLTEHGDAIVNESLIESEKLKDEYEKELSEIEKRRSKWQYAWANEKISDEDFHQRSREELDREKKIKLELEALYLDSDKSTSISSEELKDISSSWGRLTQAEKKQFIQLSVKEIIINKTNQKRSKDSIIIEDITFN